MCHFHSSFVFREKYLQRINYKAALVTDYRKGEIEWNDATSDVEFEFEMSMELQ